MADILKEALSAETSQTAVSTENPQIGEKGKSPESPPKKKKFVSKDLLKCVIVLASIAVVAGVLLGVINWLTYVDPETAIKSQVAGIYGVSSDDVSNVSDALGGDALRYGDSKSYVKAVYSLTDSDGQEILAYYSAGADAYSGTVEFVICVKDGKIDSISVYSHSETASIGGKVLKQDNLNKYVGFDLSSVTDYGSVSSGDAKNDGVYVSGATKSTKSVINAVTATAYTYNNRQGGNVL